MGNIDKLISNIEEKFTLDADMHNQRSVSLLFHLSLTYLWETQCLFRILCWKSPELTLDQVAQRAKELSENLTLEDLTWLYELHPAKDSLEFLVLLRCWRKTIFSELNRRVEPYKAGKELVAFLARREMGTVRDSWILPLLKTLMVEKVKVKTYLELELDTETLLVTAVNKAIDQHRELGESKNVMVDVQIPSLPEGFLGLPAEPEQFRRKLAGGMTGTLSELVKFFLPLLDGELEDLPEVVRQHLRNEFRTLNRRKKILGGKEDFPKGGPDSWRADWDFTKRAAEHRHEDIDVEVQGVYPTPEEYLQRVQDEQEEQRKVAAAYEYAQSRWGEAKGRIFLDTLSQEKGTVKGAAEAVGVGREMGQRYKKELRMRLSKKNPPK